MIPCERNTCEHHDSLWNLLLAVMCGLLFIFVALGIVPIIFWLAMG